MEAFIGTALFVFVPFMVLYFSSIGLSLSQVGIVLAAWPLASLLFEVPTSAIADIYGRRASVLLGWTLEGIIVISIFFTTNYIFLLGLMMLLGISQTLVSGAYEAWSVDLLKQKGLKKFIPNYFSKIRSLYNMGFAASGLIGAFFVMTFGLSSIWPITGISFFVSVIFLYFAEENFRKRDVDIEKPIKRMWKQVKVSAKFSYRHSVLFYLLAISFIFGIIGSFEGFMSWTPVLESYGFPEYAFGYLWFFMGLFGIGAPFLSKKLMKKTKEKNLLMVVAGSIVLFGFLMLLVNNIVALIALFFFAFFMYDFEDPVWKTYFHKYVPSKTRATIGSLQNMIYSLAGILFLPIAGYMVETFGGIITLFASSMLMIPVIILYLCIDENSEVRKKIRLHMF
jgi:MFS family permease